MQNTELRPLGAGEILDRAVTLFVRRFVPIVAVLAVVVVPLLAVEAVISPGAARVFDDFGKVMAAGPNRGAAKHALDALTRDSRNGPAAYAVLLLGMLLRLLMFSAVVAVIAGAYSGASVSFGAGYRTALRRWPAQIVVALAYLAIGTIAAVPLVMATALFAIVLGVMLSAAGGAATGIAVAIVVAVLLLASAAFACVFGWLYMAYNLAAVAVVTEPVDVFTAVGAGLRRAFGAATRWRTLVAGLIIVALTFGGSLPIVGVAIAVSALLHVPALYYAIAGAGSVVLEGLVAAFIVVYATDVRVRREGLDLVAQIQPA